MSNFNYYDFLKENKATNQWIGEMNKSFNNLNSPIVKVFKLDFSKTKMDDVYNEESHTRVYVRPFDIRAKYIVNPWKNLVGMEGPYQGEETFQLSVNFEDMVQTIRALKTAHFSELKISYSGHLFATICNLQGFIVLKENNKIIRTISLKEYDTTDKVRDQINLSGLFNCDLIGKVDLSDNLVSFEETPFYNYVMVVYSEDKTYSSMTDAIEMGDVVLTLHNNRVYEIKQAYPAGNMGWDYHTYILNCELADMDKIILPEPFNSKIWNKTV